jgi:hypothetical protein
MGSKTRNRLEARILMGQNKSFSKSVTPNRRTETRFRGAFNNQSTPVLTAVVLVVGMSLNGTSEQTEILRQSQNKPEERTPEPVPLLSTELLAGLG